jgi:hypothetical protein
MIFTLFISIWASAQGQKCNGFYRSVQPVLSYGLEVEYSLDKNRAILFDYRPMALSDQAWMSFSKDQQDHYLRMYPNLNTLVRLEIAPSWLPAVLEREYHGTFEANKMIFEDIPALTQMMDKLERRFGRGAAQVHVVFEKNVVKDNLSGFVSFSADRAQLGNLVGGYAKYLSDNRKIPAANFTHSVLGPLDSAGEVATKRLEKDIRTMQRPPNQMGGKYYLSTVLRAGVYDNPELVGYEIRQFSYDHEGLAKEVVNVSRAIQEGRLGKYKKFFGTFESEIKISERIKKEYGHRAWNWFDKMDHAFKETSLSYLPQNILYVLRDWKKHPILESLPKNEQIRYRTRLLRLEKRLLSDLDNLMSSSLTPKELSHKLRILVAKFAYESRLFELFETYEGEGVDKIPSPRNTDRAPAPVESRTEYPFATRARQN